jgi:hypothetical protein
VDTLIIFDWDDTLFPTTWLQQHGFFEDEATLSTEQEMQMKSLAQSARLALQVAMQIGKVVIVTNAEQGWIEMSCTKFMPSLVSLLRTVDMVSARASYEQFTESPSEWKRLAFRNEVDLMYGVACSEQKRNIVSIGDSLHELNALKSLGNDMASCCKKCVKLLEQPTIMGLLDQHEVISSSLLEIAEYDGDLDIAIGAEDLE